METLAFSRFRTSIKLTPEQVKILEVLGIIDAGEVPDKGYFYHFPYSEIGEAEKEVLLKDYCLEFVETRKYELDSNLSPSRRTS